MADHSDNQEAKAGDQAVPLDRILIGHIAGGHGIKGELLIKSYTEDPLALTGYACVTDETGKRQFVFKSARLAPKGIVARLEAVRFRDEADLLKGTKLFITRDQLPDPGEEEFYHHDLIGLSAELEDGSLLGTVKAVQNYGAGDLLEVTSQNSQKQLLFPFTKAVVPVVDLNNKKIIICPQNEFPDDEMLEQ